MIGEISPHLAQYGKNSKHLNKTEAIGSTREERVRSCWGIMITYACNFHNKLSPRQKANYSIEDILVDLWITLSERDHLWNPSRGAYSTFAWHIIHNELRNIFDKSCTVSLPRNSSCRVKKYQELSENGSLAARQSKTYEDIKRITRTIFSLTTKSTEAYQANDQLEDQAIRPNRHFTMTYYSKIPDPKSTTPDAILEESEKQAALKPIIESLRKKFPGQKLTNPRNRNKIRKFLAESGITSEKIAAD